MRKPLHEVNMLTTKEYRTVFNQVAAKHGIDWVGTWTDDILGRGYTSREERLRTVTHSIGHNDLADVMAFTRALREAVGTECDVRLTSYYIKATCEIHQDIWDDQSV